MKELNKFQKKRGYSLKQLGIKSGLSENTIYSWQRKSPSISSLEKVAKTLDVSTDYLVGKEEPDKKQADFDDLSTVMRFEGKKIPEEDRETLINMLRSLRKARREKNDK